MSIPGGSETVTTRLLLLGLVEILEAHGFSVYASIDQNMGVSHVSAYLLDVMHNNLSDVRQQQLLRHVWHRLLVPSQGYQLGTRPTSPLILPCNVRPYTSAMNDSVPEPWQLRMTCLSNARVVSLSRAPVQFSKPLKLNVA